MGSMSRRKGRRWENTIVAWLRDNGFPHAERQGSEILAIPGLKIVAFGGEHDPEEDESV